MGPSALGPVRWDQAARNREGVATMDEEQFNMALRKFLKQVGVTSQREIERVAREGAQGQSKLKLKMVLTAEGTDLNHVIEDEIKID